MKPAWTATVSQADWVSLNAQARRDGFTLSLVRGSAAVQRVFELTGTAGALPFVDA